MLIQELFSKLSFMECQKENQKRLLEFYKGTAKVL